MNETKTVAAAVAERFRSANGFHPFLLTLQVIVHADETGTWEPKSRAELKRALRRPKDVSELSDLDLDAVIRHAISMGLLEPGSTVGSPILVAGEDVAP